MPHGKRTWHKVRLFQNGCAGLSIRSADGGFVMPSHTTSAKAAAAASAEMIMDAVTNAGVPPDEAAVIGKHMMMQELRVTQLEADLQDTMRALQRLREYLTARDSMEGTE